jgi:drug/metabolite transporter (DMT)-like permease
MAYFYGLQFMTLDGATSITYLLPIIVSYLATIFFKEKLTKARVTALLSGFIGIIIILKPGTNDFQVSALWIIISVFVWSACDLITKKLGKTETVFNQAFYTTFFGAIISAPLGLYYWVEEIAIDDFFIITLIAILLILQIISIFKAFLHADFSIVMPFDYFRLPISAIFGYIMFGEVMALNTIIGSTIIILAGLYLIRHEHKKQYVRMPIS